MTSFSPRLRMFAGPNGSGKSTMKSLLSPALLGIYLNADEIELQIRQSDGFDFDTLNLQVEEEQIFGFLKNSTFLQKAGLSTQIAHFRWQQNRLNFENVSVNSYYASVIADFVRRQLLRSQISFTFETVMSSPDKVESLRTAQEQGFRTYLYFVATQDPEINLARVQNRVKLGGHDVPAEKIVSRYARSLDLLREAIRFSHRAYIFDNSGSQQVWLAEITDGQKIKLQTPTTKLPAWFKKAVLQKMPFELPNP